LQSDRRGNGLLISTNTHIIQQPLLVAPLSFNFDKKLEMDSMAQQVFDIFPGTDANLFQTGAPFPITIFFCEDLSTRIAQ